MTITKTETALSTLDYCRNFPEEPKDLISRDNFYKHLETLFSLTKIVYLNGEPLSGKSVFVANYMRNNSDSTIGVFLTSDSGFFYSVDFVKLNLSEQIRCLIKDENVLNLGHVETDEFNKLLFKLQKLGKKKKITFVIDGLDCKDLINRKINEEILQILPIGQSEFRFIFCGDQNLIDSLNSNLLKHQPKEMQLLGLSKEESNKYLSNLNISSEHVLEITNFCTGKIGHLQKLKQFINDGVEISKLLHEESTINSIFEFEWNLIPKDNLTQSVLSFLAFCRSKLTSEIVSELINSEIHIIENIVANLKILDFDRNTKYISFKSELQRKFIEKKLASRKKEIEETFINRLINLPETNNEKLNLPSVLFSANKYHDLIKHLDSAHFVRVLNSQKSLNVLRTHAEYGLNSSRFTRNIADEIKFSLITSTLSDLTFIPEIKDEVEALFKLDLHDHAIELATAAPTSEEKFKLFASIANCFVSNELLVPPTLKTSLNKLVEDESLNISGKLAIDIACDLVKVNLKQSITIFEKALQTSVEAIEEENEGKNFKNEKREKVFEIGNPDTPDISKSKLNDNDYLRFSESVGEFIGSRDPNELLEKTATLSDSGRLYVYTTWIYKNSDHPQAFIVANQAIDLLIRDTTKTPSLRDLRQISIIILYIENLTEVQSLINRIENQIGILKFFGTSEESVRLEMNLIIGKFRTNDVNAKTELNGLFDKVNQIEELDTRITCLSWILNSIKIFPDQNLIEDEEAFILDISTNLICSIDDLLASTAQHFKLVRRSLIALSKADPEIAFDIAGKLNTVEQRNSAFREIAINFVINKKYLEFPDLLLKSIEQVQNETFRNSLIILCLDWILQQATHDESIAVDNKILNLWKTLRMATYKLHAITLSARIHNVLGHNVQLIEEIRQTWKDIVQEHTQVQYGYWLVNQIASFDKKRALELLHEVKETQLKVAIPSNNIDITLFDSLSLAIRAYAPCAEISITDGLESLNKIAYLINSISSHERRIISWTDLAIRLHFMKKDAASAHVVTKYIHQILNNSYKNNEFLKDWLIVQASPALYLHHSASYETYINKIESSSLRDEARLITTRVLLRKLPPQEPFKSKSVSEYKLNEETISDILAILKNVKTDGIIDEIVEDLTKSITAKININYITRSSAFDHLKTILKIVESSLPDKNNIQHEGYLLISLAYIHSAISTLDRNDSKIWEDLYIRTNEIKNVADRTVVLAIVGSCSKGKGIFSKVDWLKDVKSNLSQIPALSDRMNRLDWVARIVERNDKKECRLLLSEAMKLSNNFENPNDAVENRKKILDFAYGIDPALATTLIGLLDDDLARAPAKDALKKRVSHLQLVKNSANDPAKVDVSKSDYEELVEISRTNLGAFNANRLSAKKLEEFKSLAQISSNMPLSDAKHVWSWILANHISKHSSALVLKELKFIFEAILLSAELVLALTGTRSKDISNIKNFGATDFLIEPGDRDKYLECVKNWLEITQPKKIKITDPFFGPQDLDLIKIMIDVIPNLEIIVLTSKKHCRSEGTTDIDELFHITWTQISDMSPPDLTINVINVAETNEHPIHDRWILAESSGLRLGTSNNSIGINKISEISELSDILWESASQTFDLIVSKKMKTLNDKKLFITSFTL